MEPLFQTETVLDFSETLRFHFILSRKSMAIFYIALIVVWIQDSISKGAVSRPFLFLLLLVLVLNILLFFFLWYLKQKNDYQKDRNQNSKIVFRFFEEHFEKKSPIGTSTIYYDKLYKVIETKTNFYLMISPNQGDIIQKENCTEQLIEFLHKLHLAHR